MNPLMELDWSTIVAILLFVITTLSKYLGCFYFKKEKIPIWSIPFTLTIFYFLAASFISIIGLGFVLLILLVSIFINQGKSLTIKFFSGFIATLIFLGLGFKILPGFDNLLLVDTQILKGNSIPFTSYFNFDKTIGGLIFFLIVVPTNKIPSKEKISKSLLITLITSTIVLIVGNLVGLIEFNSEYFFNYKFLIIFIVLQLFSTCLAEETFFRGFVQQKIYLLFKSESFYHKTIPLLISSILFGLVHYGGGVNYMLLSGIVGLGYGLTYQITKRIEVPIIAHTILNIIHLSLFTYPLAIKQ